MPDNNANGFTFHMNLGQVILGIIGIVVTILLAWAGSEFSQARASELAMKDSVVALSASVNDHHMSDAARDAACRTDVDTLKERLGRMEIMLERVSLRVGAQPPPRRDSP